MKLSWNDDIKGNIEYYHEVCEKSDRKENNMLEFNSKEELQNCKELQNMCRYEHRTVKLNGEEVIACTTNQQYEDIIWGGAQEILEELDNFYGKDLCTGDLATEIRDFILARLESEYKIKFVDVFDEY